MRILFCSLDGLGFLYPAIGLALELRNKGHCVAFATNWGAEPLLSKLGIERISRGTRDGSSFQVEHWFQPLAVAMQVKHVEHAVEQFKPDILVGQPLALGPFLVRDRLQIPVAVQGLATYLWPNLGTHACTRETQERLAWRFQSMMKSYNSARAIFGLPECKRGPLETPLLGDLFLLRSVEALVGPDDLPECVHLVGACIWEPSESEEDAAVSRWLSIAVEQGRRIAYVQPGRTFGGTSFWPILLQAASRIGDDLCFAASVGRMDTELSTFPETFLVRDHINQGTIYRYAALAINNGTTTAVLGALSNAMPSLLVPGGGEQVDLAECCERVGVSLALSPSALNPASMRKAIEELLEEEGFRQAARQVKHAFSQVDGFDVSVDLLEMLASTGRSVSRSSLKEAMRA